MRFLFLLGAAASIAAVIYFHPSNNPVNNKKRTAVTAVPAKRTLSRLQSYAAGLKSYAARHQYNTHYCFLVDMKIPCGSNRFFVYDLTRNSICKAGLVTHGYGNSNAVNVSFSNTPGSNSSSLGKYRIGGAYNGKFGLAFKLYGLDSTNSNAFNRFVVLHSHECVPANEVAPQSICMSQGCPTVAPAFLKSLKVYLDNAEEPILLRIFY